MVDTEEDRPQEVPKKRRGHATSGDSPKAKKPKLEPSGETDPEDGISASEINEKLAQKPVDAVRWCAIRLMPFAEG